MLSRAVTWCLPHATSAIFHIPAPCTSLSNTGLHSFLPPGLAQPLSSPDVPLSSLLKIYANFAVQFLFLLLSETFMGTTTTSCPRILPQVPRIGVLSLPPMHL